MTTDFKESPRRPLIPFFKQLFEIDHTRLFEAGLSSPNLPWKTSGRRQDRAQGNPSDNSRVCLLVLLELELGSVGGALNCPKND